MPFVEHDDVQIHYRVQGTSNKPPLLLLHWFMGSMETFYDVGYIRKLQKNFRLILVDHRGYGLSSKPHNPEAYQMENHVKDIVKVLDSIGVDTVHALGYSMGGRIAFALGYYAPERVDSLIIGGMHPFDRIPTDLDERIGLLEQGMEAVLDAYGMTHPVIRRKMMENDTLALRADTIQTKSWKGFGDSLHNYNMPILLFAGSEDGFTEGIREAASKLANAILVVFPNEDHRTAFTKRSLLMPHLAHFLNVKFD